MDLPTNQRAVLERGLAEFDRTVRRRHTRRRVVRIALSSVAVVTIALIAMRFAAPPRGPRGPVQIVGRSLPSYVEVIRDDDHLTAELELASACERIGRSAGRIYVVECSHTRGVGGGR